MRIGVDARVLSLKELRGIANYLLEILKVWPSENDEFIFFYECGEITPEVDSPARIHKIMVPEPPGTKFKAWNWLGIPKELKKHQLDLLWCPSNIPIAYGGCPQVVTIHDTLLQENFRKHTFIDSVFYRQVLPFWLKRYVSKVVTVSHFSKSRISSLLKFNSSNIDVVYNGPPSVQLNFESKEKANDELISMGLVSDPYVYALGAQSFWKNTERLLAAFIDLSESFPRLQFVISGIQEKSLPSFKKIIDEASVENRIKLIGFVDKFLRNTLYQGAELFVYPSLFEGFGFPPIEAMSAGCPVVASDRASIPEVVGNAAVLVDCLHRHKLVAAIEKLLLDKEKLFSLKEAGYKNVSRFNWNECARKHRCLFEEVLE